MLNLPKYKLNTNIEIRSVHGVETATEMVIIPELIIICDQDRITINNLVLVVVEAQTPTDIILGHRTLKKFEVYARLGGYFGSKGGTTDVAPAVKESGHHPQPARRGSGASVFYLILR